MCANCSVKFKEQGLELLSEADESTEGPASLMLMDPDGNPISDRPTRLRGSEMEDPVVIEAHDSHCNDVEFTEDSKTLVSAGMDNVVKLWSVGDWKHKKTFEGHEKSVNSLSFSPDGKTLVTGSTDESLNLWSFPGGKLKESRPKASNHSQVSRDGKYIASVIRHKIKVSDYASGEELFKVDDHDKNRGVMFSPDSKTLYTSGTSDHISMWSVPDGEHLGRLEGHNKVVMSMKFAKDGKFFASTGYEGTLRVWFADDWEEVMAIPLGLPRRLVEPGGFAGQQDDCDQRLASHHAGGC